MNIKLSEYKGVVFDLDDTLLNRNKKISLKKSNKSIRRIYQLITITVGISLII